VQTTPSNDPLGNRLATDGAAEGQALVGVVLVNYLGWRDTIECLESLLRVRTPRMILVVCDNGSTDDSIARIRDWAAGGLEAPSSPSPEVSQLTRPPIEKPIQLLESTPATLSQVAVTSLPQRAVLLVANGSNLGFAGGNNVALRWFAAQASVTHVWLLNNDTVVTPDALSAMLRRLETNASAGICGARLLYYHAPGRIQTRGGLRYQRWLGISKAVGALQPAQQAISSEVIERQLDMIHGSCMLITRRFLGLVGLLAEDYFLYGEEIDWATRAERCGFTLAYADDAVIYHKEGAVIGTSADPRRRSLVSDFYAVRSRLRFAVKFFPYTLPTVYLGLVLVIFNRLRRGQLRRALMVIRLALQPSSYRAHTGRKPPHQERGSLWVAS
jgi:GT2 family glycosyltransferase